ncbi:MAG TPA: hypothetical protein DCQ06_06390, partial [Myxococcales bacterium]|nr:hypothetical protein [Myxococcales bacterium]
MYVFVHPSAATHKGERFVPVEASLVKDSFVSGISTSIASSTGPLRRGLRCIFVRRFDGVSTSVCLPSVCLPSV